MSKTELNNIAEAAAELATLYNIRQDAECRYALSGIKKVLDAVHGHFVYHQSGNGKITEIYCRYGSTEISLPVK